MRIALIGPTHPYKGGIAHHTTELAHRLGKAGHDVDLISWSAQYPSILYPGVQRVPHDKPETAPFDNTSYPLSWKNPATWAKVGRKLRTYDQVVIVFVSSVQVPIFLAMLKALGRKRPEIVALCHNVSVHEGRFFDPPLIKKFLRSVDRVLVHTPAQAEIAKEITSVPVTVAEMAPHLPAKAKGKHSTKLHHELLFFGVVRRYKGVDILIKAVAEVPGVHLTIAGEIWGGVTGGGGGQKAYEQLIEELHLQDRVTLLPGYVPSQQIPELFAKADALVLPYRSGTGTQNITLAHNHGIPVIATKVGSMAQQVRDNQDGLLCEPDNIESLSKAIKTFYEPGVAERLAQNVRPFPEDEVWETYITALLTAHL